MSKRRAGAGTGKPRTKRNRSADPAPVEADGGDGGTATAVAEPPAEDAVSEEATGKKGRRRADTTPEEAGFLGDAAEEDRANTKAKHVDDGLKGVSEMVDRMKKGVTYAKSVHDFDTKLAVLNEVADTAANVTDDARRAIRNAKAENRNLQPST